ncbi:MAG TPA: hypothetical protein VGK45_18605 [Thermoanaerobaculia bacterium]
MNSLRRFVLLLALTLILPAAAPIASGAPAAPASSHHVLDADLWKA